MPSINAGTVAVTLGSPIITGSGTTWITDGVNPGAIFVRNGSFIYYVVQTVDSETQITFTSNYVNPSEAAVPYTLFVSFRSSGTIILTPADNDTSTAWNRSMDLVENFMSQSVGGFNQFTDLLDTNFSGLLNNDIVQYDLTSSKWINNPVGSLIVGHGTLTGLTADDHNTGVNAYHTDARGDARYSLTTSLAAGELDTIYFQESEHINVSTGSADQAKPVLTNGSGELDTTFLTTALAPYQTSTIADGKYHAVTLNIKGISGNYVLIAADAANNYIRQSAGTANTFTVNTGIFTPGQSVPIVNSGTGVMTFVAGGGVTLNSELGALNLAVQYRGATLTCVATDVYDLVGALT